MPSLSLPDRLIWFAHCPKAGGTSVERFMVERFGEAVGHLHWGWDLWWRDGGWRCADPPNSPQHLVWEDALAALPRTPDAVFAVVRDPLNRLISEYRYQQTARRGTMLGRCLAYLPFSTWVRLMLGLAAQNPYAFDNHLRPQGDFVPEGARVFRLEEGLQPALQWLAEVTGASAPDVPPHVLAGSGKFEISLYSEDIKRISVAYAGDYTRFGYTPPEASAFPPDPFRRTRSQLVRALLPVALELERCARR